MENMEILCGNIDALADRVARELNPGATEAELAEAREILGNWGDDAIPPREMVDAMINRVNRN